MSSVDAPAFSKLRSFIWPIHRKELKKFLPMLLIYALIVFNYSILKAAKDALVVTAPASGAEAIPFIKFWAILPMAVFFTYLFTRLSNRYTRERVFYVMIGMFLAFFFLFSTVLYPFRDVLHPNSTADWLQSYLPHGFKGLISIFRNWTFTLFYVMSELWGTTIMTVLFWGFTNAVSTVKDAKRFYAILGVGANLATIVAGEVSVWVSREFAPSQLWFIKDNWGYSLFIMTSLVVVSGIASMFLYHYLTGNLRKEETIRAKGQTQDNRDKKIKMGIRENFAYLAKSKYLMRIAIIVLTFNISLNMIEIVWKDQVRVLFPNPAEFNAYMGKVMSAIGVSSTIISVFICGPIIRRFGWTLSAMVTPMILLVTGILFFSFLLFKDTKLAIITSMVGMSPLALGVFFGSMQNCFSRACKFTFFDATKEMAFIPLSDECKLKGKAAIDGVGSRLGKSGGSVIHQFLLLIFGSVSLSTPFVAIILFGVVGAWIFAVKSLGRRFSDITSSSEVIEIDETDSSGNAEHVVVKSTT